MKTFKDFMNEARKGETDDEIVARVRKNGYSGGIKPAEKAQTPDTAPGKVFITKAQAYARLGLPVPKDKK